MLDLDAARRLYDEGSTDLTVGLEEEFGLCDPRSLLLVPRYEELKAACLQDEVLARSVSGELIASEIEIRSGRGEDLQDALARQADHRARLFATAERLGLALHSTGTHALSDYRDQQFIDTEHYRRVADGLRYVAERNNTFSLHVHVGVQGADRAIRVCDRLRPVLPALLAISASSPFVDGHDSGLHSARTQTFTKSFPRCGVPDAFGSWAAWADYVDLLVRTGSISEYTQVWWSVRPHHAFGTVEVRICDAQQTAAESDALAALVVACVAQAALEVDADQTPPDLPGRLVEENLWRAIRHGLDGRLLEFRPAGGGRWSAEEHDAAEAVERLLAWTSAARGRLGIDVPAFPDRNGAQRQRAALDAGAAPHEVFAATIAETAQTYATATERIR